jgi:hypothetical protein
MGTPQRFTGLSTFLVLSTSLLAVAQQRPATAQQPNTADAIIPVFSSFAAAHDTLVHRATAIRAQTDAHLSFFTARQGSLGGLHRKVLAYNRTPGTVIRNTEVKGPSALFRKQTIKHRYGIELEKTAYYDTKGRLLLLERREGHQLTRLELREYSALLNKPKAQWLFVRGDYLKYTTTQLNPAGNSSAKNGYFFSTRPAAD